MTLTSRASVRVFARRRIRLTTSVAVVAAAMAFAVMPAVAVTTTPYNTNLVKNPGFEAGSANDGTTWVAVPNWYSEPNSTVVAYGASGGFPTTAEGQRISGGNQFWTSGLPNNGVCAYAAQRILITGRNSAIDSGHIKLTVRARAGTYDSQSDTARMTVFFYNATSHVVGIFSMHKTGTQGLLVVMSGSRVIPVGTRSFLVSIDATNAVGYCDAYFDNIKAKLIHI